MIGYVGGLFATMIGAAAISALLPVPYIVAALGLFVVWAATLGRSMLSEASDSRAPSDLRHDVRPVRLSWLLRSLAIGSAVVICGVLVLLAVTN